MVNRKSEDVEDKRLPKRFYKNRKKGIEFIPRSDANDSTRFVELPLVATYESDYVKDCDFYNWIDNYYKISDLMLEEENDIKKLLNYQIGDRISRVLSRNVAVDQKHKKSVTPEKRNIINLAYWIREKNDELLAPMIYEIVRGVINITGDIDDTLIFEGVEKPKGITQLCHLAIKYLAKEVDLYFNNEDQTTLASEKAVRNLVKDSLEIIANTENTTTRWINLPLDIK